MREINGQSYQHATVVPIFKMTGAEFRLKTFSRISYSEEVPTEPTRNAQGQIDGFTYGDQAIEAEIEMKLSEWLQLRAALLANAGGLGVMQCTFDLPVAYGNTVNALVVDTLRNCHVTREPRESSSDQAALMVTIPMFVTAIEWGTGPAMVYEP